ncbi:MAG: tetratricopeptide repeat protein [Cyanobacteriota bacterium]|nr:tetratricopeptide repeat protein [Cyanobacteriota bacterium]
MMLFRPNLLLAFSLVAGVCLWKALPSSNQVESGQKESAVVGEAAQPQSGFPQADFESLKQDTQKSGLEQARLAMAEGSHAKAIQLYAGVVAQSPESADLWVEWGEAYLAAGNCHCAIVKFTQALALDPQNPRIYHLRSQAYALKGDLAAASADAQQSLAIDPNHIALRQALADMQQQMGDPQAAQATLMTGLWNDPLSAELWQHRADLAAVMGKREEARVARNQAYQIRAWRQMKQQESTLTWQTEANVGIPSTTATFPPTAIAARPTHRSQANVDYGQQLNQQVQQAPDDASYYLKRAHHFWHQSLEGSHRPQPSDATAITHNLAAARRDLDIAIALDPQLAEAYWLRSQVYRRMGELDLAEQDLQMFATLNPQLPPLTLEWVKLLMQKEHLPAAHHYANQAIQSGLQKNQTGSLAEAYWLRGQVWAARQQWSEAFADYSEAIERLPYRPDPYYYRALARLNMGSATPLILGDLNSALLLWQATGTGSFTDIEHARRLQAQLIADPQP